MNYDELKGTRVIAERARSCFGKGQTVTGEYMGEVYLTGSTRQPGVKIEGTNNIVAIKPETIKPASTV